MIIHEVFLTSGFGVLSADFKTASQSGNLFSFCFLLSFAASKYSRQVFRWLATLSNSMTPPTLHLSHLNWCSVSRWPSNFNGLAVLNGSFFASSHHGQLQKFHKNLIGQSWRFAKILKNFKKISGNLFNLPKTFHSFSFLEMTCLSGFKNNIWGWNSQICQDVVRYGPPIW